MKHNGTDDHWTTLKEITAPRAPFIKGVHRYEILKLLGPNIIASEGEDWRKYRKISAPAFSEARWISLINIFLYWLRHRLTIGLFGTKLWELWKIYLSMLGMVKIRSRWTNVSIWLYLYGYCSSLGQAEFYISQIALFVISAAGTFSFRTRWNQVSFTFLRFRSTYFLARRCSQGGPTKP